MRHSGGVVEDSFEKVFSYNLAGAVSALAVDGDTIFTGTSLGFLSSYDLEGRRHWMTSLNGRITRIFRTSGGLLVFMSDGTMYRVGGDGRLMTMSMDSMAALGSVEQEDNITVIHGNGIYRVPKEGYDEGF